MRVLTTTRQLRSASRACRGLATGSSGSSLPAPPPLPAWFKRMTTQNEYAMPRLPVPQLADTLARYLESVRPLVSEHEWEQHAALAEAFEHGDGRALQNHLLKRELAQAMSKSYPFSYIEADWDEMYLGGRYENPINVNPAYGLVDESDGNLTEMVPRTAAFVRSALKWWTKVKTSELEQDPKQCMFSFARQFGTARVPKKDRDVLESYPRSSHIVVLKDKQFYQLEVLSPDGKKMLSQDALETRLHEILNASHAKSDHPDVDLSLLSAENRDTWAQVRDELIAHDPVNEHSLRAIDSALFVLVLDERSSTDTVKRMELALHGDGAQRWFDKVQVIAQADGHLNVNFEHSFSDGTAWNRWIHEVWHDMRGTASGFSPLPELPEYTDATKPTLLSWKLSNNLVEDIKKAEANFQKLSGNVKADFLKYTNFAKKDCKVWKLSPDGIAQMAFQLAFFREHGHISATYESCSTRAFHHGRTETIRAATPAAAEFVKAVAAGESTAVQREKLVAAVNRHVEMAKNAQKGLGCDRHLTALSSIANEVGIKSDFLQSPIRAASTNFQISSSNVTTPFLQYFNFGAVVPHGYGVGYLLHNDTINVSLTNFKDSGVTDSTKFKQSIAKSLDTIKDLANAAP